MAVKLLAYKQGSESAKALAEALGIKRLKDEGSRWEASGDDIVINWGRSSDHAVFGSPARILNRPGAIGSASHKIKALQLFQAAVDRGEVIKIPGHTTARDTAYNWLISGSDVVVRTILQGHSGEGIQILTAKEDLDVIGRGDKEFPRAPLYTSYVRKNNEYRIHVMNGEVFFVQRKARKLDVPDADVNWKVRNLEGGFIYTNQGVEVNDLAKTYAITAVAALGLDFGAVDIIETKMGNFFVLEVNTACGLAGTTLDKYVEAFKKHYEI